MTSQSGQHQSFSKVWSNWNRGWFKMSDSNDSGANSATYFSTGQSIFLVPEVFNIVLLSFGIVQMYNGIEIDHPVYKVLFTNLVVTLASSVACVATFFVNTVWKFSSLLNAINYCGLMFHYSSWCVISILRLAVQRSLSQGSGTRITESAERRIRH